jgi:hypothetical protein
MAIWKASKTIAEMILVWAMFGSALRHASDVVLAIYLFH